MASGLYAGTFMDIFDTTQLAVDFDREDHLWALYNPSKVPDYNVDAPVYSSTNEISGTGYVAKGKVVTGTALSKLAGVLKYSSDAVQWPGSTLTNVRHVDMVADFTAGDPLIMGIDLGLNYSTSDGTLLITPHSSGLFTIDFTP
ncbi:hypothetical protein AB0J63_17625 [Streptosporangium canum]|uniref:hypothetical protein n=1 Tax=Streptosporangium canum TaxID=324952 RepID=UPI0034352DFF